MHMHAYTHTHACIRMIVVVDLLNKITIIQIITFIAPVKCTYIGLKFIVSYKQMLVINFQELLSIYIDF